MARVVFSTVGSWGDLFPVIGTALEVQRRGHDVEITASPAWADLVADAGLPFTPVGRRIGFEEFSASPEIFGRMPFALRALLEQFMFDQIDDLTRDLRDPVDRADLLVSHPAHIAALNVAEHSGTPVAVATVFPAMLPSAHRVPGGTPVGPWTGPIGRSVNRLLWTTSGIASAAMFDKPINAHRRSLGLEPVRNALIRLQLRSCGVIVLADPAVIDPPPDWPDHVHVTSFVDWDQIKAPDVTCDVEEFLRRGECPVLVTLGTSTSTVAGDFFRRATESLLERGARVLSVTGPAPPVPDIAPGQTLSIEYVPYSDVLPHCRAVVHHAGIGTTLAVLRSGLAQLALPMSHDQPDTGRMIERLGVGLRVPWKHRDRRFGQAADRLLDDEHLAANATAVAAALSGRDGAGLAADRITQLLGERPPSTASRRRGGDR